MVQRRVFWRFLSIGTIGATMVLAGVSSAADPGCDTGRPAVAYNSNGDILPVSPVPVPCAVTTGFAGAESQIKVAPDGTLIEEPAMIHPLAPLEPDGTPQFDALHNYSGWAVSSDEGENWVRVIPENTMGFQTFDNGLYIDRTTGRAFGFTNEVILAFSPIVTTGSRLMTSMPPYTSWNNFPHPYISENPRFTSAPAPAGQPAAAPGENPAYWCGNVSIFGAGGRACHRTLDGGTTWTFASQGPSGNPVGDFSSGTHRGSLWSIASCGGTMVTMSCLARSDDEATTWPVLQKPDGSPLTVPSGELRVDTDGNLYIVQKTGSSLLLQISRDGGLSWSDPLNMTAPAARSITLGQSAVAVGAPGQVAVSYLAAAQSGTGSDGYITVTHDALKADGTPNPDAVFYAATVNSPDRQLVTQGKGGADDYIAVDVGPDGTPWASFYSDCLQNADGTYQDPGCGETQGQGSTGVPPVPGPAHATTVGHLEF